VGPAMRHSAHSECACGIALHNHSANNFLTRESQPTKVHRYVSHHNLSLCSNFQARKRLESTHTNQNVPAPPRVPG
jgi:hypothetical protein